MKFYILNFEDGRKKYVEWLSGNTILDGIDFSLKNYLSSNKTCCSESPENNSAKVCGFFFEVLKLNECFAGQRRYQVGKGRNR